MDRSRVLQPEQLQESQARLAKAEAELAEAAGKLRAWSEAGLRSGIYRVTTGYHSDSR